MRHASRVPIIERTPRDCFRVFTDHIATLVAQTVTSKPLIPQYDNDATRMTLQFREQHPVTAPLQTNYGTLYFHLAQYWYRLQQEPDLMAQAAIRWEYDAETQRHRHARHHVQMHGSVALGGGVVDLNKAHAPAGWVLIEEIIRFMIVDLGLAPPCGDAWPEVLDESERLFYEEFTGKRHKPTT